MSDVLVIERIGAVARLTLNRPDKLNAFNEELHIALYDALEKLGIDPSLRAIILTGAGRGFCAGQDLADRAVIGDEQGPNLAHSLEHYYNPLIRKLRAIAVPVIAAVNGVAAGAGANIALACDIVIAAVSAKFIQPFQRIGLIPDSGGTWILPRLIGPARARAVAMLGEPVTASQALEWGMIWQSVADSELAEAALALANRLAELPPRAIATTKLLLETSAHSTLDQQLDLERDWQDKLGRSGDYREGVAAFMGKRPARFTGE